MALATTTDYQNKINRIFFYLEDAFAFQVGAYNQDGSVQVSPFMNELIRYGFAEQDTSNYPEPSTAEIADKADWLTIVTAYLAYRKTRDGNDTNDVTV